MYAARALLLSRAEPEVKPIMHTSQRHYSVKRAGEALGIKVEKPERKSETQSRSEPHESELLGAKRAENHLFRKHDLPKYLLAKS